jgi:hypothetical protein
MGAKASFEKCVLQNCFQADEISFFPFSPFIFLFSIVRHRSFPFAVEYVVMKNKRDQYGHSLLTSKKRKRITVFFLDGERSLEGYFCSVISHIYVEELEARIIFTNKYTKLHQLTTL